MLAKRSEKLMKKCNIQKEKYELASYTILILAKKMWRLGLQLVVVLCDSVHELSMEDIGPFLKDWKKNWHLHERLF